MLTHTHVMSKYTVHKVNHTQHSPRRLSSAKPWLLHRCGNQFTWPSLVKGKYHKWESPENHFSCGSQDPSVQYEQCVDQFIFPSSAEGWYYYAAGRTYPSPGSFVHSLSTINNVDEVPVHGQSTYHFNFIVIPINNIDKIPVHGQSIHHFNFIVITHEARSREYLYRSNARYRTHRSNLCARTARIRFHFALCTHAMSGTVDTDWVPAHAQPGSEFICFIYHFALRKN